MALLIQGVIAWVTVLFISVYVHAPRKSLPYIALSGAIGWVVYYFIRTPDNILLSTFIASSAISLSSHILSRRYKVPTTVFLIPALYPFVPGSSLYRAVYALIINDRIASNDYFIQALLISGTIATAVFMFDSLFILLNKLVKKKA